MKNNKGIKKHTSNRTKKYSFNNLSLETATEELKA